MNRGDSSSLWIGQQDRKTIRRANRHSDAGYPGYQCVSLAHASRILRFKGNAGVNLFQTRHGCLIEDGVAGAKAVIEPI